MKFDPNQEQVPDPMQALVSICVICIVVTIIVCVLTAFHASGVEKSVSTSLSVDVGIEQAVLAVGTGYLKEHESMFDLSTARRIVLNDLDKYDLSAKNLSLQTWVNGVEVRIRPASDLSVLSSSLKEKDARSIIVNTVNFLASCYNLAVIESMMRGFINDDGNDTENSFEYQYSFAFRGYNVTRYAKFRDNNVYLKTTVSGARLAENRLRWIVLHITATEQDQSTTVTGRLVASTPIGDKLPQRCRIRDVIERAMARRMAPRLQEFKNKAWIIGREGETTIFGAVFAFVDSMTGG